MKKYIDADRLKQTISANVYPVQDAFNSRDYGMFWTGGIEKAIDEQPTADVVEVGNIEHEMAVILAEIVGCPCDYGDIGETLCEVCEIIKPGSYCTSDDVACWEQYLKHRKEVNE